MISGEVFGFLNDLNFADAAFVFDDGVPIGLNEFLEVDFGSLFHGS